LSAHAASVRSLVVVITELTSQVQSLQGEVEAGVGRYSDTEIYRSSPASAQPGCPGVRRVALPL
jgi:hypothetical protein